jgi:hypothetical protein
LCARTNGLDGDEVQTFSGLRTLEALQNFITQNENAKPLVKRSENAIPKPPSDVQPNKAQNPNPNAGVVSNVPVSPLLVFSIFAVVMAGVFYYVHTQGKGESAPITVEGGKAF